MSDTEVRAGGAFVEIGGRNEAFKATLRDSAKKLREFGSEMRNIGLAMGGALAGVALAFYKALADASKMEETSSKFDTVFKEQGVAAKNWAMRYADAVGRGREQIMSFMAETQDMFVPLGFARDKAADLSIAVTTLANDLSSFNDTDPAEALRDIKSALVGNHEAVRKYGVMITEVTLQQQLMKMGVMGGTQAASEQQKTLARLKMIFEGNSDAQTDALRTADSWANKVRALQGWLTNLSTTIGRLMRDTLKPYLDKAVNVVRVMDAWIQKHPEVVAGALKMFRTFAIMAVALIGVGQAIVSMLSPATYLVGAFFAVLNQAGLDTGLNDLKKGFADLAGVIGTVADLVKIYFDRAWEHLKTGAKNLFAEMKYYGTVFAEELALSIARVLNRTTVLGKKMVSDDQLASMEMLGEANKGKAFADMKLSTSRNDKLLKVKDAQFALGEAFDKSELSTALSKTIAASKNALNMPGQKPLLPDIQKILQDAWAAAPAAPKVTKYGVVSMDAGASLAENLGAAEGAGSLQEQQLQAQQDMLTTLGNIEQNTRQGAAWQ